MSPSRPHRHDRAVARALRVALVAGCAALSSAAAWSQAASAPGAAASAASTPRSGMATVPVSAPAQAAAAADAKRGGRMTAMCSGCHNIQGYQASFPEIYKVPMISGQNAKYIANALVAYRKGERKHPTMRTIAAQLSDRDIADLAAFYEQQGAEAGQPRGRGREPSPEVAALLGRVNCASCHGADYNSPIDPAYPKLAGQYPDYLYAALKAYQMEGNPHLGRANPIMSGMAKGYTLRELKTIADYLGSLPAGVHTVQKSPFH